MKYKFSTDSVADSNATVSGPCYRFTLINDVILRYEWSHDGVFEDRASTFALNRKLPKPSFLVQESEENLEIITQTYHLSYDKRRFSSNGLHVTFAAKVTLWGAEWRYGDAPEKNLGGTARTLDEVDGRCDMGTGILSQSGFSTIDDSDTMLFDSYGFVAPRLPGDRIDGYLFCYGVDYKAAMRSFYAISGHQPRLPRWSLGNWWSRYHKYSAKNYVELMDKFRAQDIPLSVAVIDMDWHLVNDERVPHAGWTGYTWNEKLFPNPEDFGRALHSRKLKITLNDHPHGGIHHHEELYEEMAKALDHDSQNKIPILFDPTNQKFMEAWFEILHRSLEKQACDFWWIDWQQGNTSRVPGLDPLWLLNHFHFLDNKQNTVDGQALIFSRYAGPGSHRYPVGFSGDSITTWASLAFQPEFTATASNIGYGWWSHDIGGHMQGYRDDELAARWVQFGCFSPILRLHSSDSRWTSKEPWLYRADTEKVVSLFLRLRHRLVPYTYSANAECESSDEPLVQPMYWTFPVRKEAYEYPNQYKFGKSLVVAPIVHPKDKRTNLAKVKAWVPPSRHIDIFTGFVYDGDRELDLYRTIYNIPVLAPEGSIIPFDAELAPDNGCQNPDAFEVFVVVGRSGRFTIVESPQDDRDGQNEPMEDRLIEISFDQTHGRLSTKAAGRGWSFRFIGFLHLPSCLKVLVNGTELPETVVTIEHASQSPGLLIKLPSLENESAITIELGPNPQLSVVDHLDAMSALILDMQVEFALKDTLWAIVAGSNPDTVKVGQLISLGLEEPLLGPVLELMLSDSRLVDRSKLVNGVE